MKEKIITMRMDKKSLFKLNILNIILKSKTQRKS